MEELLKQFMEQMNNRFDQVDQRFVSIEGRLDGLTKDVKELKVGQDRLQARQDQLQVKQDHFQAGLDQLQARQDHFQAGLDRLQAGQDQLKDSLINGLGPYFEQIEKHIDTKTESIKETLNEQQSMIDTLSARSIKHESEIKDLKASIRA
jgi:chromosome segregation ATPase